MYEIHKDIPDYSAKNNKSSVMLNPNKTIYPYSITYPIEWKGFVAGVPVTIIQKGESSSFIDDYDFGNLPPLISNLKHSVVEVIDNYLKRMLD
ncbi:hypothetical protein [Chryseobacterium viscerum]|jgi:hypothetical protein|uniref:hypothetical protein n=1 Tax=Chryseobacterium viscerum TaxID=1037377 RepID=UPI002223E29C|nr:hypothetical protein [Chryseobacterium viscerum]MCW1963161.1 hypothetical protein [Chryseobacterium viscerum]